MDTPLRESLLTLLLAGYPHLIERLIRVRGHHRPLVAMVTIARGLRCLVNYQRQPNIGLRQILYFIIYQTLIHGTGC